MANGMVEYLIILTYIHLDLQDPGGDMLRCTLDYARIQKYK